MQPICFCNSLFSSVNEEMIFADMSSLCFFRSKQGKIQSSALFMYPFSYLYFNELQVKIIFKNLALEEVPCKEKYLPKTQVLDITHKEIFLPFTCAGCQKCIMQSSRRVAGILIIRLTTLNESTEIKQEPFLYIPR